MHEHNIKTDLKELIIDTMIPESQSYIDELKVLIDNKTATDDDFDASTEMISFLEELNLIVKAIDEDDITDEEAQTIYDRILTMIEEHH